MKKEEIKHWIPQSRTENAKDRAASMAERLGLEAAEDNCPVCLDLADYCGTCSRGAK